MMSRALDTFEFLELFTEFNQSYINDKLLLEIGVDF